MTSYLCNRADTCRQGQCIELGENIQTEISLHHDPVCGMDIEEQDATGTVEHQGKRYFFCSEACIKKFRRDQNAI